MNEVPVLSSAPVKILSVLNSVRLTGVGLLEPRALPVTLSALQGTVPNDGSLSRRPVLSKTEPSPILASALLAPLDRLVTEICWVRSVIVAMSAVGVSATLMAIVSPGLIAMGRLYGGELLRNILA